MRMVDYMPLSSPIKPSNSSIKIKLGCFFSSALALLATRNSLTFVNTTAIAYTQKVGRSLKMLVYAIAVVFTNVRELRVVATSDHFTISCRISGITCFLLSLKGSLAPGAKPKRETV